jgi:superfamily II DNA helicase RecQ
LVHFCTPASLEQYAQELALLGTLDGPTEAVLCFSPESLKKNEQAVFKLRVSDEEVGVLAQTLLQSQKATSPTTLTSLEQSCRLGRKATLRVLRLFTDAGLAQVATDGTVRLLVSEGDLAQAVALLAADLEQLRAMDGERLNAVVGYVMSDGCRVQALTSRLGGDSSEDAEALACGYCDRCAPEGGKHKESSQRSNEAATLVVRRRPAAQIWSVKNPADAEDFDDEEDDGDDEDLVVQRVASQRPGIRKIRD